MPPASGLRRIAALGELNCGAGILDSVPQRSGGAGMDACAVSSKEGDLVILQEQGLATLMIEENHCSHFTPPRPLLSDSGSFLPSRSDLPASQILPMRLALRVHLSPAFAMNSCGVGAVFPERLCSEWTASP